MTSGGADAIVVLGCRVHSSGRLTTAAEGRAEAAADAYRAGLAPVVVTSGGRRWGARVEAIALRDALVEKGVPASAIHVELCSMTTYENAVFSAALLGRLGARSAVVVTCSWHAPRAIMSFRSVGIAATAWPREAATATVNRIAERIRFVFDTRALRGATTLTRAAAAFFRAPQTSS
jgi:uncharacterized SAM-binding protein YcdF (DUF218 family)